MSASGKLGPGFELPVVDGFTYSLRRLFDPGWFEPMALGQLEALRKAGAYRPRWYAFPQDWESLSIPAYTTVEQQVRMTPGAYLWGFAGNLPANVYLKVVEGDTGIPLFSDFMSSDSVSVTFDSYRRPILLTQPRLITGPGWINVEIANSNGFPPIRDVQLVFFTVEPCRPFGEVKEGDPLACYGDPGFLRPAGQSGGGAL